MLKIKIQEIGRSMVEMLGVLAIIGILSIGGVAGYRYAMDRHIANDVLHESNIRGFDVSANFKGRRLPDISEIGGYAKFTGTGKPISVYPNPSDFVWSEYSDKCRSEELCQAFDVEVRGLNKRQCSIIMQSGWDLPDAIMVYKGAASGEGGNIGGEDTAPIAMVSATKPIVRTASSLDSSLCDDFGDEETDIAIRFRFVSTFMDFADEDTETGWEDEGNSDETDDTGGGSSGGSSGGTTEGGSGETGGGEGEGGSGTVPDDDEPVECSGGKEDNGFGICECPTGTTDIGGICKTNCKGGKEFNSAGVCECPDGTTDVKGICRTNCTGNFAFDGEGNCTVCIKNWYGDDCNTFCTATWSNGECLCAGDAYWGGDSCIDCGTNQQVNETKTGCECKSNWYGNDCSVYCDESVATMDGGVCICTDNSKYWNGQSCLSCGTNKVWKNGACACDDTSYPDGEQCIQCPSGTTPTANGCKCDGDNEYWTGDFCLTCDSNATFDAENNECICNTGYYGSGTSCSECKKPRITNETNTECACPNGTNWTGEDTNRCEEPDDGSGGVTDMCDSGLVWDSVNGECVSSSCSSSTTCPHGYVCDITDGRCIRNWNCSNPNALDVSQGKCLDCENRVWTEAGKCTACPSNQTRINGICNCPDSQLFHDATCVDFCPTSAPFVDVRNCVIECPNDKPAPDVNNVCQPCPDGTGWNAETNACELLINDTCVQGMLDAGFDESEFTVVGSEIRVDGDLKLENSLYVPECKLVLNGDLIICEETPYPLYSDVSAGSIKPGELCCPEGQIEQDGECVADIGLTCVTAMTEAGISADMLTREGTTIKYASDMVIENDLDISACDLEVAGTLTINSEITFRVNNITAETSEENGIYVDTNASFFAQGNITGIGLRGINNNGTMECVNMSAIGNGGIQYTTLLNKGVIRATGDVSGSGSTAVGINNQNTLEAKNVTGLTTSNASIGIVNTGVLTVKEIAAGTGHQTGIDNSGTLNAQQVKGIGQATEFAGGVAIINRGQIVAEIVIADRQYEANNPMIDENVAALTNESNGVITAYNVYYCRFISNLGKIIGSISCNCTDSTQCSGTTPTACTAPTPVLLGNLTTCVSCKTADSTKPYWNGFACVATCSGDKPVADDTNNICITCAEADDSKPYSDGTQCVAECPAGKPIANNGVCSTECSEDKPLINDGICVTECPTGTTEVSGLCLSDEATVCATEMINAGFNTSDFMMNGMTIKYKDDLMISSNLDISTCNLDVAGTVTVDLDVILKVNNLTAESNDYIGIYNNGGVIEATTATGKSNTEYSGIYNSGILSISGDVIGTSLDDIGVYNEGTMDVEGDIEGISITYIGIENNEGIINAANVIGTSGEDNGVFNSGTITTTGDVIGTSEEADFDGVNNDTTGVIVATNIYYCQTINNDGQIIGKVSCNCVDSTQCVGAEPLVCQMPTPVLSGDLSTCLSCTDADFGMPYWDGNSCVDECPADKPVADEGVCVVNCPENKPFIDEGICLAVCPADKPFSNDGVCVATCPENTTSIDNMCLSETAQSCYTAMSLAEFSIDNFTMQGVTIKYTGDMVIQNSLDISGCNLEVAGTLDVNSGKTLTVNNVKAESISEYGINNYGTIEANSVSGTSESKAGINNYGTIEANNVSGTSKSEVGIDNYDTIEANSVSGISESKAGIDNYGTIEANNVSGTSENGNGIENTHIIKGQNIYYCKTINNTGQISGSISCNCVDNTQCAGTMPTVCTVPTPVLYSSNQCYSCEDSFLFEPYWNAENGSCQSCIDKNEATPYWNAETDECTVCPDDKPYWSGSACESACPLEKPIYNANKICSSCPVETPYWNGNTCVESCPNDNPVHGNICDIDETSCSYLMSQAGYTDFTVTGNTITYNGEMEISSDLDISVCNLNINGTLYVKSDKTTLKANNIIIKNTFGVYGVRNAGTITVNKIIAENLLGAYGIWNDGTITATEIKGVSRSGRGINNANSSVIKANAVIGISTDGTGTDNWGTIEANTVTGNSETGWGLVNYNTITATTVTGSSLGSQPAISNFEEAVITAENVYYCKKISNTGKITGTISCNCADSTQCSGTAPTQCTAPTPVLSGDLTTCISCETADSTKPYYDGKMCVATCPTETPALDANNICKTCADVDSTKPIWDAENKTCIACGNGTSWDGVSCVTVCSGDKPVWNAEKGACEACAAGTYWNGTTCGDAKTFCTTAMDSLGITGYTYDETTNTINYSGSFETDVDLHPCNLNIDSNFGLAGTMLRVKNIKLANGIHLYGGATLIAEEDINVVSGGETAAIWNMASTIKAGGNITGKQIYELGISNEEGGIIVANGTITGIGADRRGILNRGVMKANSIVGLSQYDDIGLDNHGTIYSETTKYCPLLSNSGKITGTISCDCSSLGLTCSSTTLTNCSVPTPVLSGDLTTCISCEAVDSTTPYFDGKMCVSTCPADKPVYDANKVCITCSGTTPYYDGTTCVATCPSDKPVADNGICVTECPTDKAYNSGGVCVVDCSSDKPIKDEENKTCSACPAEMPRWNGSSCEACAAGAYWNGTTCGTLKEYCTAAMGGYDSANYTVSDDGLISYTGKMVVAEDLDISACDLEVSKGLEIANAKALTVKNVSATNDDGYGIYLISGADLNARGNVVGQGTTYGIYFSLSADVNVGGDIVGTASAGQGVYAGSETEINVNGKIIGTGSTGVSFYSGVGGFNSTIKAKEIIGTGDSYGISLDVDNGTSWSLTANAVTGTGNTYGIYVTNGDPGPSIPGLPAQPNLFEGTIDWNVANTYYCKNIYQSGTINISGTLQCASGCACDCSTDETICSGDTPACSGGVCTACPAETPYWSESEGVCVERCDDGYFIPVDGKQCVTECPIGQYIPVMGNKCVTECPTGQFILANRNQCAMFCEPDFIPADGNQCVTECPMDQFIAADRNQCVTECPIGQYIPVEGNQCVTECPTGQFIAANGKQCVIQCRYDEYIENNQCTASCSSNKPILDEATRVCQSCAEVDSTKPLWDSESKTCIACGNGTSWDGVSCVTVCSGDKPVWNAEKGACEACAAGAYWNGTSCGTLKEYCTAKMSGYDSANYVVSDDGIITYTSDMTVASDLDISGCDLDIKGTLTVNSGKTLKVNNVSATSTGEDGIFNIGTIEASGDVIGTSSASTSRGVYNEGTINTAGSIVGTGNYWGVANAGTIEATTVTGTGNRTNGGGIGNTGSITATESISGTSIKRWGIYNYSDGTITAPQIYYCYEISNSGQIIGAIGCGCPSGTSCTSTVTQCTAPTPVLSGNLTTCASCETADSTKPYFDGTSCVASCPTEKPSSDSNKICSACSDETPYWNELGGVCVERCDDYIDGNRCVDMCEGDKPYYKQDDNLNKICILPSECKFNLEHTKQCVEMCDYYISADGKQCVIQCPMDQFIAAGGNQCVTECPIGQYIPVEGNQCVTECPTGQFIAANGKQCVTTCLNEYIENNQCTESCSSNKPILDEATRVCQSCAEVDSTKPLWDSESKTCIACGNGTLWNGSSCVSPESICTKVMTDNGFSTDDFTVEGSTIIYNGDMTANQNLDFYVDDLGEAKCNLTVNGMIDLQGHKLSNLTGTISTSGSTDAGIKNAVFENITGTISASGLTYGMYNVTVNDSEADVVAMAIGPSGVGMSGCTINNGQYSVKAGGSKGFENTTINGLITEDGIVGVSSNQTIAFDNVTLNVLEDNYPKVYYCPSTEGLTVNYLGDATERVTFICASGCACDCSTDSTVCSGETSMCDPTSKKCVEPNCSGSTPVWDENSKTCIACSGTTPYFDGTQCVSSCPTDKAYINDGTCVSTCPTETPAPDANNICKTCSEVDSNKPIWDAENKTCIACGNGTSWDGVSCVTVCSGDKPVWNAEKGECEACAEGTYWNGMSCGTIQEYCTVSMGGYDSANYTVSADGLISYTGNMTVDTDLDVSICDLSVEGALTVNKGRTLKVNNVLATSTDVGIDNFGRIEASGDVIGTGSRSSAVYNEGTINTAGSIVGTGGRGVTNLGTIEATTVTGTAKMTEGIYNDGTITATTVTGTGGRREDIYNLGTITATTVTGTDGGEGIYNAGTITATDIYYCPTMNNLGKIIGKVNCGCPSSCTSTVTQCTAPTPVLSGEACITCAEADSTTPYYDGTACVASCPTEKPASDSNKICSACPAETPYYDGTQCVTECPTDKSLIDGIICVASCPSDKPVVNSENVCQTCAEANEYKPIWDDSTKTCIACGSGTSWDGMSCVTVCSGDKPVWNAEKGACEACANGTYWNGTSCGTLKEYCKAKMSGYNSVYYAVSDDGVITYAGEMVIAEDLDISGCDLDIKGTLTVNNGKTLKVNNVSATSTGDGISNIGTIEASGDVIGTGSGSYSWGVYNVGTINTAGSIVGTGTLVGVVNEGTIEATNIYYCSTISNSGQIIGKISCNCEDSTQCSGTAPTQCTPPTPVLSGNLTTCITCSSFNSSTPYYDGTACVASCPTEKPASDSNKICSACPAETPYWSELGGVCVERCDDYIDGNRCVDMCEGDKPYYKQDDNLNKICILPSECKFNLEHTKQCVERCDGGYFISADGKQCVIQCPMDQFIAAGGNQCVTECPTGQYIPVEGNMCVTECPTGQFIAANGKQCVTTCLNEYIENNQCTESCSSNKPILDEVTRVCQSCAEVDSTKPLWDSESKTCIACGNGTSWNGSSCVSPESICTKVMTDNGFSTDDFTVEGSTITYNSELVTDIAKDVDLGNTNCSLTVKGTLNLNYGTMKNVSGTISASSSTGAGIEDTWFENITGTISGTGLTVGIKNVKVEDSPKVDIVATATTTENTGVGMTDCTFSDGEYSINASGTATGIVNTMISNSTISDKGISGVNDGTTDSIKGLTIENTTSTGGSDDYDVYYCKSYENVKNDGEQLDSNSNILKCAVGCPCDCAPGYALTPENTCVPVSCAGKLMQLDPLNPPKMTYANGITTIIGDIVVQSDIDFANEEGCDINIAGSLDLNDHTLSNMIGNVTVNNSAENSVKTFAISNGRFENMSNSTVTVTGTEYGLSGVYFLSSQMTVNATATNGVGIFGGVMDNVSGSVNASGLVQGLSGTELYSATLDITTTATATGSINGKTVAGMVNADIRESTINIMATGWDYGILGTQINDSTITEKGIVGLSTSKGAGVKDFTLNGVLSETGTLGDYSVSYCQSYENVTIEGSDAQNSDFKVLKCAPGCACDCTMDSSVCFGDTPICNAATKTCIAPNCSEDKPIWDANSQTCVACVTADSTKPYWDGTTCVSSCPSGKRDGYICVTNCPSERPYLSDGVCVSECSGTKLYRDGATCVSACPSDKPSLDEYNVCRGCPRRTPYWNGTSCVTCESIDPDKPYWYEYWSSEKTNACISEDQLCSEAILDRMGITDDTEGVSYTYDTTTNTLTINFANYDEYNGIDLWDIDLSPCNLVVNNSLVNIGSVEINSLTANNPKGEYGIMIHERMLPRIHGDLIGTGKHYGIINIGHKLTVGGSIIGTAVDATGSISDSFAGGGLPNMGVVNFLDGTISATKITGINYSEDGYGVVNGGYYEGGTITANTISYCQNIMNVGEFVGQVNCDCSGTDLSCSSEPITTCSGDTPVSVMLITGYDDETAQYIQEIECISCDEFDSSKPYWDDDTQMCTACPTETPYWNGTDCSAACPSGTTVVGNECISISCPSGTSLVGSKCVTPEEAECAQGMVDAGFITGYEVNGTTIQYTGNMEIENDLYISSCDLEVEGLLDVNAKLTVNNLTVTGNWGEAIICDEFCEIEASGDVYGEGQLIDSFNSIAVLGFISAENVIGIGDYGISLYGGEIEARGDVRGMAGLRGILINQNGSISAGGDVIGDGASTGISNDSGIIHAINVSGTGSDSTGVYNAGEIIAEQKVLGQDDYYDWDSYASIENNYNGIIIAPTISYCKTINNDGSISGTIKCASGCDCACSTDETICSGSTPMCDATENVCTSCGAETPYYDGTMCVLNCPAEKPVYDSDNICQTCADIDSSTPIWDSENQKCVACAYGTYWDGTTCATLKEYCTVAMSDYDSANYTVSDDGVITHTGNMTVSEDLDISNCDLVVAGTLTISNNMTLKVNNVTATASSGNGININTNATIIAIDVNSSGMGIGAEGINNKGVLNATDITASGTPAGAGISNTGTMTIENEIFGTGGVGGITNSGNLTAKQVKGIIADQSGVSDLGGVINSGTIKALTVIGESDRSTNVPGGPTKLGIVNNSLGLIEATTVSYCLEITNSGKIIANINCNCEDSTQCEGPETTCTAQTPVLSGDTCVTCETADGSKPYYDGTSCVATCPTGTTADKNNICISETVKSCQEAMINAGFNSNDFTMEDTTIKCNFNVIVERDLDVSGCNLEVDGMLSVYEGVTLRANNVLVNGNTYGIDNAGTIDVVGDVTGAAMFGIVNNGMIKATTVTGMLSGGTFGGSGLLNNEVGTIMATNVYYCPTMNNLGKIIGKVNCGCSEGESACRAIPAECSTEDGTPILLGDACVSCATVDISKPYWNGTECIACETADGSKPYYDGTSCVATCPTGTTADKNNICYGAQAFCEISMKNAGYDEDYYEVTEDGTVYYIGDMVVSSNLDLSICDLKVDGALQVSAQLDVKNVAAVADWGHWCQTAMTRPSMGYGILLLGGIINATGDVVGVAQSSNSVFFGILLLGGTINATGSVKGYADQHGISTYSGINIITAGEDAVGVARNGAGLFVTEVTAGRNIIGISQDGSVGINAETLTANDGTGMVTYCPTISEGATINGVLNADPDACTNYVFDIPSMEVPIDGECPLHQVYDSDYATCIVPSCKTKMAEIFSASKFTVAGNVITYNGNLTSNDTYNLDISECKLIINGSYTTICDRYNFSRRINITATTVDCFGAQMIMSGGCSN